MDYSNLIDQLTPEVVADFSKAVEIGKWKDGKAITNEQKESLVQAILLYNARYSNADGPFTVDSDGALRSGKKARVAFTDKECSNSTKNDPKLKIPTTQIDEQ